MIDWMRWLGFDRRINGLIAPSLASLEARLARLAESQAALEAEVAEVKAIIDATIRRNTGY